jgi:hypothetical protein
MSRGLPDSLRHVGNREALGAILPLLHIDLLLRLAWVRSRMSVAPMMGGLAPGAPGRPDHPSRVNWRRLAPPRSVTAAETGGSA